MWWYLGLPLLLVAAPFVLGPVLVKFTQRIPAEPEFAELDPEESLPPEVYELFSQSVLGLSADGFEVMGFLSPVNPLPGQTQFLCLLVQRERRDLAMAAAIFQGAVSAQTLQALFVEFFTPFEGGAQALLTNNTATILPFEPIPGRRVETFVSERDPRRLYRIHRALLESYAHPAPKPEPAPGSQAQLVIASMQREYEAQVGTGYLRRAEDGSAYLPTWKGACLMTWKLCWPASAWLRRRREARAEALLAGLRLS
ncbi:MAG: hypothetical protein M5U26_22745 [Planctomycetota bacterium]|nr:hypothetical protein [Planctomycetota bacterium]